MAELSNEAFNALKSLKFSNSAHINLFFKGFSGLDFIDWFNANLAGTGSFKGKKIVPLAGNDSAGMKRDFAEFWDNIPMIYKQPEISLFDFATLMCIAVNETGGQFSSVTEKTGAKGLAYTFNARPEKKKRSYNTLKDAGNVTAHACFTNPVFCRAHAGLSKSDILTGADNPQTISEVWKGEAYPSALFTDVADLALAGFIMQADFFKFRGRGPIQITGRNVYREIVKFIKEYTGPNAVLQKFKSRWQNLTPDDACYASNDLDWDEIFREKIIVARSLRIFADLARPTRNMFVLDKDLNVLNQNTSKAGSFWSIGRIISGSEDYATNTFKPRVVQLLEKIAGQMPRRA